MYSTALRRFYPGAALFSAILPARFFSICIQQTWGIRRSIGKPLLKNIPPFLRRLVADELIRHVTLDGPERGLLCLRVRDEIRMTIDAYKTLYDSSVTFGVKKQLQAEQGMAEMEEQARRKILQRVVSR